MHIEAEINPTESEEKVKAAINNILDNASITINPNIKGSTLTAEASGQASLMKSAIYFGTTEFEMPREKLSFTAHRGNTISFCLNKQVAFAGHISFSEETAESPLGPIRVTIKPITHSNSSSGWLKKPAETKVKVCLQGLK